MVESSSQHGRMRRRTFLADCGMGFTGMALGATLYRDGVAKPVEGGDDAGTPHLPVRAKSVIWFFMMGGTSHLESFDPKPALNRYAGRSLDESPLKEIITDSPYYRKNVRDFAGVLRDLYPKIYPLQVG